MSINKSNNTNTITTNICKRKNNLFKRQFKIAKFHKPVQVFACNDQSIKILDPISYQLNKKNSNDN